MMSRVPREVAGFVALPIILPATGTRSEAKHYLYVKPHEPRVPDEITTRSLFLVNIPILTTALHIRHLFATQLEAGRVENVEFNQDAGTVSPLMATTKPSRKRKRQSTTELESALDVYHLPPEFPSRVFVSASTAVVTFVDRPNMDSTIKAVRRAVKRSGQLVWGAGLEAKLANDLTGLERYNMHKSLRFPSRASLLKIVDNYMTGYSALESAQSAENARKKAVPDDEGFVTVTRGNKASILKEGEAEDLKAKQKAKEVGLEDFYRFQMREKRKEQAGEFLKKFEADKRKVEELRRRRKDIKPED